MTKFKIIDNPLQREWESFLEKFVSGSLQQSFDYGEVVKDYNPRTKVVRLLALDGDYPVGLVQCRFNRMFGFGDRLEVGGVYGSGPLVADKYNEPVLTELIAELEKCATKNRVSEAFIYRLGKDQVLESLGYTLIQVFNVYKVALQKTAEELWSNIAYNKRKNIKKAQRQGVEVVEGTSYDDLASFYEMLSISGKRAEFIPHPFSYFHSYLKIFGANDKAKVFLAVFDGQQVAGVFVVIHGDTAYALGAGSREGAWHVRPNDMLHWKVMEWACSEGLSHYHMGFVDEPPSTKDSSGWGVWRWKREWNGRLEKMFLYHKVYRPIFKKLVLAPYENVYNIMRKIVV
jgi:lipid II:glycine glycyltransferase (peptidoglycan interpeptide bridge formation enzyme)